MKCLWLTRKYPRPVNSGELIYSDGLIRSFAATGVDLTVIAHDNDEKPVGSGGESSTFQDEQGVNWRLGSPELGGRVQSLFTKYPGDAWRLKNGGPEKALREAIANESWDAIVIDHAAIGWAVFPIDEYYQSYGNRPVVTYVSHNHEAKIRREIARNCAAPFPRSTAIRYDAWKYARLENHLCETCDLVTAITDTEVEAYRENFPEQEYLCLTPGYDGVKADNRCITTETPRRAVMSGSFEWIAKRINLELFLDEAAEKFAEEEIELQIVGKTDTAYKEYISGKYPSVSMVGRVPEMTPYLEDSRVGLIVEEHGGGFKLKSLEYIFHGLPLAGLNKAVDGLPLSSPGQILLADSIPNLVEAVAEVIDDLDRLNKMRTESFRICESSFRWQDRGRDLLAKIESLRGVILAR
ncbi:MAG: glycosyltransferase [Verrucomicrobiales bacterium]|nr:glycosyltransferase [Verrucomicrobiales bacterium]